MPATEDLNEKSRTTLPGWIVATLVVAVAVAAYWNSFSGVFVFDDHEHILQNRAVRITSLTGSSVWQAARQSPTERRPVANATLAINYYFGEYNVWGYHAVNLAIHILCGALVYLLAQEIVPRMIGPKDRLGTDRAIQWIALVAALIFVSHPLQTQAVTYVVQRMASLTAMFYLAALVLYVYGRKASGRRRWLLWGVASTSWLLALGSKENAVTLPAAILLVEGFCFQKMNRDWLKRCCYWTLPILALLALAVFTVPSITHTLFGSYEVRYFTPGERVLTQFRVVVHYLSLVVWPLPSRLSLTHDVAISRGLFDPSTTFFSLMALVGLLVFAVYGARRWPVASFAILWTFLHLAVESSVIPLELAYEHRMYLPMVGLSVLTAWALLSAIPQLRQATWAAAALVVLLSVATHVRNRVWHDELTVWTDVLAKYPHDSRAHNNLGLALAARDRHGEAIAEYQEAIRLNPRESMAHNNLGNSLALLGKNAEASEHYRQALKIKPDYAQAHYNLGAALAAQGQLPEAVEHYQFALEQDPKFYSARNNLGVALAAQGKLAEATVEFRKAVEGEPESADALINLGNALAARRLNVEAIETYRRVLEIVPGHAETLGNLGALLALQGNDAEAIDCYRAALRQEPTFWEAHMNLAQALLRTRSPAAAVQQYREALQLAQTLGDQAAAQQFRTRLDALEASTGQ